MDRPALYRPFYRPGRTGAQRMAPGSYLGREAWRREGEYYSRNSRQRFKGHYARGLKPYEQQGSYWWKWGNPYKPPRRYAGTAEDPIKVEKYADREREYAMYEGWSAIERDEYEAEQAELRREARREALSEAATRDLYEAYINGRAA
jgi:hypothetical protein